MNLKWSKYDLQKKAISIACVGLIFWVFIFSLVFVEVKGMNKATVDLEVIQDLYDAILEMRRYEKNFLLYRGEDNLDQTLHFYTKARQIYDKMNQAPKASYGMMTEMGKLGKSFEDYHAAVSLLTVGPGAAASGNQEKIRTSGGLLIELVKRISIKSRQDVAESAQRAIWLPLTSSGLVIILFFIGLVMINRKVVKPLILLERATGNIGKGDFSPIHHPQRIESEVDRLVFAFNRMVEELDARQEQIIHTRKIASLGTLVSGVAHELNNPINNIILTVDSLVGKQNVPEERMAKLLNDILEQAIRAGGIVKNLLDFSRAEVSVMQDVDIAVLLKEIFKITENELVMKKITLTKQIREDLPKINGNRQSLQQVFFNLVINAIQAMAENGELTVTADLDESGKVAVTVRDTGEGIPEDNLPHIFDPFFTTKDVGKGTGLGLSVSYGIVKKHGGVIMVDSRTGEGTVFTVSLPPKEEEDDG